MNLVNLTRKAYTFYVLDTCRREDDKTMKAYSVGDLKRNFSEILERVKLGEEIEILYGKAKKPVARIIPISQPPEKRVAGFLEGEVSVWTSEDFEMSAEELIAE